MEIQKILFSLWASCLLVMTGISIAEYRTVKATRQLTEQSRQSRPYPVPSATKTDSFKASVDELRTDTKVVPSVQLPQQLKKSLMLPSFMKKNSQHKKKLAKKRISKRRWGGAPAGIAPARKGSASKKIKSANKSPMRPLPKRERSAPRIVKQKPLQNFKPIPPGGQIKPATAQAAWIKARQRALFSWPVDPALFWVSSLFGPRKCGGKWALHAGVDLAATRGTPVRAAAGGTVVKADYTSGYGNYIMIAHGKNFKTRYAHLDKILVRVGQLVTVGDYIGRVGATGFVRKSRRGSSGSHLHFEVYYKGKAVNPFKFLA